ADQAEQFMRSRRSIRTYQDKPVPRNILTRLITLASYAPSGHNDQPVHWLVMEDQQEVQKLAGLVVDFMKQLVEANEPIAVNFGMDRIIAAWGEGMDAICRHAPHLIVAHAPKDNPLAPSSGTIALTWLELAAHSLGLGACWAGFVNAAATFYPPMLKALALPSGHQCLGVMMIGYPKYKYQRLPLRNVPRITWR
ncbi:MAG: nitroreductase family protein, partial [Deltaproteobacteria bacterium]|nr:nitroreductase family protein [Deltaproteobacteria bacterium]